MNDHSIVELYIARDEEAIRQTEAKYGRLCYGIAYRILGNEADAEECLNDTYLGIWNAIPPTRPRSLSAFVCGIARNLSLKRLEALHRQKRDAGVLVSLSELEEILPDHACAPDLDDGELGRLISLFLRTQREDVQRIFLRRYYYLDSVEEIASRYGFTQSKVKSTLFHTRKRLKAYLIKEGVML